MQSNEASLRQNAECEVRQWLKFKVIIERVETIVKQAQITVEEASAALKSPWGAHGFRHEGRVGDDADREGA